MTFNSFSIKGYATNSAIFTWTVTDEQSIIGNYITIQSSTSSTGPWSTVADAIDKSDREYYCYANGVVPGHVWFRLKANTSSGVIVSSTLYAQLMGACSSAVTPVAVDEIGVPRALRVDSVGNLLMTGGSIGSGSGDASAALQAQQVTIANTTNSKLDTLKTSVDTVYAKLSNIQLDSGNIASLKSVSVTNIPTDFPSAAVKTSLDAMSILVAKEATLAEVSTKLTPLLKTSDLSFSSGALQTSVENFPTDFPDSAVSSRLLDLVNETNTVQEILSNIYTESIESKNKLSSLIALETHQDANLNTATLALIGSIPDALDSMAFQLSNISTYCGKDVSLQSIGAKIDSLLKPADLPKDITGELLTKVTNNPSDYPDSATLAKLSDCLVELRRLDTTNVTLSGAIPAGLNHIGSVAVDALPLPTDASRETTLQLVKTACQNIYFDLASQDALSLKGKLNILANKLDELKTIMQSKEVNALKYTTALVAIPPKGSATSGIIPILHLEKTTIGLVCEADFGCAVTVEASNDQINFYPISGFYKVAVAGNVYKLLTFEDVLPYIKLTIVNPSSTQVISKVTIDVRGV